MNITYLCLGSNLEDRFYNLSRAVQLLESKAGTIKLFSSIFETEPWGNKNQPYFLNQCLCLQTEKTPLEILNDIHEIEQLIGRKREDKCDERVVDIDILFYDYMIIDSKDLKIPHPLLHLRKFVLAPLSEINPTLLHPVLNKTIDELLTLCPDNSKVKALTSTNYA